MAGHSKWANIKHRKAAQDAKRGKVFTKLIREIVVAAKQGGGAVEDNPRLRAAVDKALGANMTRDTIDRAIKRGAGGDEDQNLDELVYEGYGPSGVAVMVETMTDNRNRTAAEVRHAFSKFGGNLGTDGSVAYLFSKRGEIYLATGADEEQVMEVALETGADDIVAQDDGTIEVYTSQDAFMNVKEAIAALEVTIESAEVTMAASTEVDLDVDSASTILKLIDFLEDLDDVQNVYTNASFSDEVMAALDAL